MTNRKKAQIARIPKMAAPKFKGLTIMLEPIEIDGLGASIAQARAAKAKVTQRCMEIIANRKLGPVPDGTPLRFSEDGKSLIVGSE